MLKLVIFLISFYLVPITSFRLPQGQRRLSPVFRAISNHNEKEILTNFGLNEDSVPSVVSYDREVPSPSPMDDDRNAHSTAIFCIAIAALLFPLQEVVADAGSYGVLAGRTASMLHPVTNLALFATSLYSAYLGFQWRRLRDIGEEIKTLGSQLPNISSGKLKFPVGPTAATIAESIAALQSGGGGSEAEAQIALLKKDLSVVTSAAEVDAQIAALSTTRKDLLSLNLRDKHHLTGSVLLGAGVTVSVLGAFNTYMRAGRLFPGPHLYAGMAITILWAVAASLVPAMLKGNELARSAHIALNVVNVLLFAYQIPTGIEIMLKVWEKTSWP